jgi:hypothetical protein
LIDGRTDKRWERERERERGWRGEGGGREIKREGKHETCILSFSYFSHYD